MRREEPARTTVCAGKEHLFEIGLFRVFVPIVLGIGIVDVEGRNKFDTVLIESQRMAEVVDGITRTAERQIFRNHSDRFNGVPMGS